MTRNNDRTSPFGRRDFLRRTGLLAASASAAPLLASCGNSGAGSSDALTVWWNQGFYPSEDEAVMQVAKAWEQRSGVRLDLQFYGTQDIAQKEASAVAAGNTPDIIYAEKGLTPRYAWEGRLADVTPVMESAQLTDGAIRSAQLYNSEAGTTSFYSVPLWQFTVSLFHWRSMLADVGMDHAQAPRDWTGYWQFWKDAQQAHRSRGNADVFAVGWPMGTAAGDTNYDTQQALLSFGVELLDDQNNLRTTEDVRRGVADALAWITDLYREGHTPQDSVNWQDSSNNTYFLNRSVLATPNGSLSMPGAIKEENPEQWRDIVTTGFPDRAVGGAMPSITLLHSAVVFEASEKKDMAMDFLSFAMQPENTVAMLKGGQARWFPVHTQLLEDPFFAASDDPNIQVVVEQLREDTVPSWATVSPAYSQVEGMQVWGNALGRVALQGQTPQEGADWALEQIQEQFEQYDRDA
jgi:multiple sugar transport system substrate-binding protein